MNFFGLNLIETLNLIAQTIEVMPIWNNKLIMNEITKT